MHRQLLLVGVVMLGLAAPVNAQQTKSRAKLEHFAFAAALDLLDGPSLEALAPTSYKLMANDADGNVFFLWKYSTSWIRCVRADGQVESIAGDDHWSVNLNLTEGPAAYIPNWGIRPTAGANVIPGAALTVYGRPLRGEEHGSIYVFWPRQSPYKVFRNKAKDNRWWFRRVGMPGKATPPTELGKSALIHETDMTDARIGNGWIEWRGHMYDFDEPKGKITCVLTLKDYERQVEAALSHWHNKKEGRSIGAPEFLQRADDGTFYLIYYHKTYPAGQVFRISADRKQCEHIVAHRGDLKAPNNLDGPGLVTTWHCGPAMIQVTGNSLFLSAIDSNTVRRWKDGRVSTLCLDGEWREFPTAAKNPGMVRFNGYVPAQYGLPYVYIFYPGEDTFGDIRAFRFGPVDFQKPTASIREEKK